MRQRAYRAFWERFATGRAKVELLSRRRAGNRSTIESDMIRTPAVIKFVLDRRRPRLLHVSNAIPGEIRFKLRNFPYTLHCFNECFWLLRHSLTLWHDLRFEMVDSVETDRATTFWAFRSFLFLEGIFVIFVVSVDFFNGSNSHDDNSLDKRNWKMYDTFIVAGEL